jgi:hypothetical protein
VVRIVNGAVLSSKAQSDRQLEEARTEARRIIHAFHKCQDKLDEMEVRQVFFCHIAGNFRGVQFSRIGSLQSFRDLIFADAGDHAHYTLYNRTYFAGLIFVDSRLSAKFGPHENFPLYGIYTVG